MDEAGKWKITNGNWQILFLLPRRGHSFGAKSPNEPRMVTSTIRILSFSRRTLLVPGEVTTESIAAGRDADAGSIWGKESIKSFGAVARRISVGHLKGIFLNSTR
jgi:hypothetical protein